MFKGIFDCHNLGGGGGSSTGIQATDVGKHPTMPGTAPPTPRYPAQQQ